MEFDGIFGQPQKAKYDCLLFDLDDTLYPQSSGLAKACLKNIGDYMAERLGMDEGEIGNLSDLLYKNYGTTMAGLRAIGYDFDHDEYHSFVHGRLPYENLKPDPVLRSLLLSLPFRKIIFTNADMVHAVKVLKKLGLEDCFEGIICFETLNPTQKIAVGSSPVVSPTNNNNRIFEIMGHFSGTNVMVGGLPKSPVICKPSEDAIERAFKIANINLQRTIFFDDSVRNIQAGKRIGLRTVLVGTSNKPKGADYALESIHNLKEAIPEPWELEVKSEVSYPGKVAVETSVRA